MVKHSDEMINNAVEVIKGIVTNTNGFLPKMKEKELIEFIIEHTKMTPTPLTGPLVKAAIRSKFQSQHICGLRMLSMEQHRKQKVYVINDHQPLLLEDVPAQQVLPINFVGPDGTYQLDAEKNAIYSRLCKKVGLHIHGVVDVSSGYLTMLLAEKVVDSAMFFNNATLSTSIESLQIHMDQLCACTRLDMMVDTIINHGDQLIQKIQKFREDIKEFDDIILFHKGNLAGSIDSKDQFANQESLKFVTSARIYDP